MPLDESMQPLKQLKNISDKAQLIKDPFEQSLLLSYFTMSTASNLLSTAVVLKSDQPTAGWSDFNATAVTS